MLRNLGMITAVAALALTQQACANGTSPQTAPETTTSAASPSLSPSPEKSTEPTTKAPTSKPPKADPKDPILAGKRQVVIAPVESFEGIVVLDEQGNLGMTDGEADRGLFVFTPHNGKFQIKTAKVGTGGEPDCLSVKTNGSQPLTAVAVACDTSKAEQLFDVVPTGKKDNNRPVYTIANRDALLRTSSSGLIFEELGDGPVITTFVLVDNGKSTLPALD
ncbi:hypothetical protein GCM10009828_096490 [Actinoplanes couchii]|uniref:Uncharacterized protein n=1 Tax=Actinoplanes couchii TaxID=403638 RepID=A0ABQ3XR08_9ACTN|nr:hypothetical protein Aco03nite_093090 [Actinoplanes couchii]